MQNGSMNIFCAEIYCVGRHSNGTECANKHIEFIGRGREEEVVRKGFRKDETEFLANTKPIHTYAGRNNKRHGHEDNSLVNSHYRATYAHNNNNRFLIQFIDGLWRATIYKLRRLG